MTARTPEERQQRDEHVAELLRAGATHRQIRAQLPVANNTITRIREALRIPHSSPPHSKLTEAERAAWTEQRHSRIAELLRAGATHRQITDETGANPELITRVRRVLAIPVPEGRRTFPPAQTRTVAQILAHYTEPLAGDHAHWAGPFNGSRPTLWHHGKPHQVRRETFHAHHGRAPEGRVFVDCEDPACITGAHLTDHSIRAARDAGTTPADGLDLDALYDAIFTTPGEKR